MLKLDNHAYTPQVLLKIVEANGEVKSHEVAARVLRRLAGITITGRHVNDLCAAVGAELAEQRDRATDDYLHHRRQPPAEAPDIAVVALDGGRILTRAAGEGPGVHDRGWKEDKVACLLSMTGATFAEDPHPEPPRCFLDPPEVDKLVRELQTQRGPRLEDEDLPLLAELELGRQTVAASAAAAPVAAPDEPERLWPPRRTQDARTCVATMQDCHGFGKMVAAEAYRRGFAGVRRGAVLGDGGAWIWAQQQKWFADLTAITDFVHVLGYLYVTATACAATAGERWQLHVGWMTACWQGRVTAVLDDLQTRLEALGPYPGTAKPPPTDARAVLQRTLTYLSNNQTRMNYPEYRKQGLPVNSSPVESLIKEINYRVKGTEKFWNRPAGAEGILQVRAALLSNDDRLARFIKNRPGSPVRPYQRKKAGKAA